MTAAVGADPLPPAGADARPARAAIAALVSTIVANLPAFLFGGLAPLVRADLDFSVQVIGIAVGGYFAMSTLGSIPAGRIDERIGARKGILTGVAFSCVVLVAMALSQNVWQLSIALAVGGLGNAFVQP